MKYSANNTVSLLLLILCSISSIHSFSIQNRRNVNVRTVPSPSYKSTYDCNSKRISPTATTTTTTTTMMAMALKYHIAEERHNRGRGLLFGLQWNSMRRSGMQKIRKYLKTLVLAFMLFFAPASGSIHFREAHAASTATASMVSSSSSAASLDSIPGGMAYVRKFLFNNDEYSLFDTAMREPDGQAIDAMPGMVDTSMGQPLSTGFGKEAQRQSGGMAALQVVKSVIGLAIVFGALPLTIILATQGWKIVTDFGERVTYGKDKSVGKDTYSAYDATEKDRDELDEDGDDDEWDPDNPDEE